MFANYANVQYDCLLFDNKEHVRIATLPGMWERTVTVGSAGSKFPCSRNLHCGSHKLIPHPESFSATGWRIGWLIGPPTIIQPTLAASTRIVFCTNSPLQEAAAAGLEQASKNGYWEKQIKEYAERREVIVDAFKRLGMKFTLPEGTYFILLVRRFDVELWYSSANIQRCFRSQDISDVKFPEDYPFPASVQGRGRDFKYAVL